MNTMNFKIRKAVLADADRLQAAFMEHINAHPEYISHGEIQMGVGVATHTDEGAFAGRPAPNAAEMWHKYIAEHLVSAEMAVFVAEDAKGHLLGFSAIDIEEDGADPFGMLCDLLVLPQNRSHGVGTALMQADFDWFNEKGIKDIYLESGRENHNAHAFFEHHGFEHVSNIYKYWCPLNF